MNFFKLLMAGKSLLGFSRRPIRYEMSKENALPKFGPIEKPDSGSDGKQTLSAKTGSLFEDGSSWKIKKQKHSAMSNSLINPKNVDGVSLPEAQHAENEDLTCGQPDPSESRFRLSNIFAAQNVAKASRRLVQGELVLGEVRVVRNDLSDSDVELVRVQRLSEKGESSAAGPGAEKPETVHV